MIEGGQRQKSGAVVWQWVPTFKEAVPPPPHVGAPIGGIATSIFLFTGFLPCEFTLGLLFQLTGFTLEFILLLNRSDLEETGGALKKRVTFTCMCESVKLELPAKTEDFNGQPNQRRIQECIITGTILSTWEM